MIKKITITEGIKIAECELEKGDASEVVLIYANRNKSDIVFESELVGMMDRYNDCNGTSTNDTTSTKRFRLVHVLSRDLVALSNYEAAVGNSGAASTKSTAEYVKGRLDTAMLKDILPAWATAAENKDCHKDQCRFLVVGTKKMQTQTYKYFKQMGYGSLSKHLLLKKSLFKRE